MDLSKLAPQIVDFIDDAVIVTDQDGRCMAANAAACDLTGYSEAELTRLRLSDLVAPATSPARDGLPSPAPAGGGAATRLAIRRKDGEARVVRVRTQTLGERQVSIWRDLTARGEPGREDAGGAAARSAADALQSAEIAGHASEALAQERNLLRLLIDHMPDYISVKDPESRFLMVNLAHARHLGEPAPEMVIGKTDFDYYPRELAEKFYADERRILRSGQPLINKEEPGLDREGHPRWVMTTKLPLRNAGGEIVGLLAVGRDITEQKQAEAALWRAQVELERRVAERTADLKRANEQLQSEIAERKLAEQRATRLLKQQSVANQLAIAQSDSSDMNRIFSTIYEHVRALMDTEMFIVAFYDEDQQLIKADYAVMNGAALDVASFPPIPLAPEGYGTQSEVIRTGRPSYIPDFREALKQTRTGYAIDDDGNLTGGSPPPDEQTDSIHSALLVPMKIEGKTIGVMQVQSKRLDAYSQDDVDLLAAMANIAAIALQNARLFAERRRVEAALRAQEEQYRKIFIHSPLGVVHFDAEGVILDCNERFCEIVGADREKIVGFNLLERLRDPQMLAAVRDTLSGKLGYYEGDYLSVTGNKLTPVRAISYQITAEDGRILGGVGLLEDITERRRAEEMLRQRQRELESLLETSRNLSSVLELDQLLRLIAQRVIALLNADEFTLFRLEADNETLKPILALGQYANEMLAHQLKVGQGITGHSVAQNQPIIANNAHLDARAAQVAGTPEQEQKHLLVAPLVFRDRITGAVLVNRVNKPTLFTEADRDLLAGLAQQAAIAIENARLFEAERDQRTLAEALRDTAAAINMLDLDEVLNHILANVGRVVPHDSASIMLVERGVARIVRCRGYAERGISTEAVLGLRFPVAEVSNMREMSETGQPVVIADVEKHPGWVVFSETRWIRSNVSAPIRLEGEVIGFIDLNSATPSAFTPAHAERLQAFADQAAIAIRNARLYAQVQQRAVELSTLNEIGRAVSSSLDIHGVLDVIFEQVQRCLPLDAFYVCLYDPHTETVTFPFVYDSGQRYVETPKSLTAASPLRTAIETATPLLLNRTQEEIDATEFDEESFVGDKTKVSATLMFAPLRVGARVIGAISAQSYTLNAYHEAHLALLAGVANQAAIAIENARLHTEVQRHAEELERRVEERTAELRQALAHAQDADRAKTDFVSNVNHELRTPLSNLKLYLRLLRKGHPEKQTTYLDTLDREIDRLSALVEDTLALASMGRKQPEMVVVDLVEVAQEAATRFAALAESRQIALTQTFPAKVCIHADPGQIMRVIINLLGNAITYTPNGGQVALAVEALSVVGGQWGVLTVADTGPGISPEDQKQIFTPYYRGQAGLESGVPGSGLGLAIVKEIVQLHHGRIELDSAPGQGATFRVWFPLA